MLYIVWSLVIRRVTRRLTRLQTKCNVLKYRKILKTLCCGCVYFFNYFFYLKPVLYLISGKTVVKALPEGEVLAGLCALARGVAEEYVVSVDVWVQPLQHGQIYGDVPSRVGAARPHCAFKS